jgi:TonB-dependent receptor
MTFLVRRALAVVAALIVLLPAAASAQTGSIAGRVQDAETGFALAGAVVQITGLDRGVVTNSSGRFTLLGVPAGQHVLEVVYLGYARMTREITVLAGQVQTVDFMISPAAIEVEGVTVTGNRRGQASALNQQLNANTITNVVAADQIGRFPDSNIGDAMRRIPGFVITQDQGEARFGLIRGTEPRLNSIMINGERVPSAEAEVREVQLDLIPADMVSSVEVSKALTPDMDADAIGGSVNIVTRAAPTGRRVSATIGSGYNFLADAPMEIASAVLAQRFAEDRFGVVVSGSWFDHNLGSDNIEGEWSLDGNNNPFLEEFQIREYQIQRIRRSLSASLDYRLADGHTLYWRSMYNHRDDWENRFRTVYAFGEPAGGVQEVEVERETKGGIGNDRVDFRRLEDQRVQTHALSGEHIFGGGVQLEWSGQWARASEERQNERYLNFVAEGFNADVDLSDTRRPQVAFVGGVPGLPDFEFDELTDETQFTRDTDINSRLDLTIPLFGGRTELKVGGRYRDKEKLRDNNFFEYSPVAGLGTLAAIENVDYTNPGYLAGNYAIGRFASPLSLGFLNLRDPNLFEETDLPEEYVPANFDANERILGGYFMVTHDLTSKASLVGGLRIENTDVDYTGFRFVEDTESAAATQGNQSYTNFFPSLLLRYELSPRQVIRAAWTNTLARPNYFDIVPFQVINEQDNEIALGNPDLDPTLSMNFDLMYEQYFSSVGIVSAGVFYKDIQDFIFNYTREDVTIGGNTFDEATQPQNGGDASLFGVEVAFQRQLDFLPGVFAGLGFYGNYTFTDSNVDGLPIPGRESEDLPLPGTSRHTANASISYDYGRVSVRGSLNFQDDFIDPGEVGDEAFFDRYYDSQTTIDLNGTIGLSPTVRFFFEANNLTNEPLRYYQGIAARTMQEEFYDRRFQAGLKIDLR